jgi:hypothetical protein
MNARQMLAGLPVRGFADGGEAEYTAGLSAGRQNAIEKGLESGWLENVARVANTWLANPGTAPEAYDAMVKSGIGVKDLLDAGISQDSINRALSIPANPAQQQVNQLALTSMTSTLGQNPNMAIALQDRGAEALYAQARDFVANLQQDGLTDAERRQLQTVASQQGWGYADIRAAGLDPNLLFGQVEQQRPPAPVAQTPSPLGQPLPSGPDLYAPGQPALDMEFRNSPPRTAIPGMPGAYEYTQAASLRPATGAGMSWTPPVVTSRPRSLLSPTALSYTSPSQQFSQTRATQDQALLGAFRESGLPQNASNFYSWRNRLRSGEFGAGAAFDPNAFQSAFGSWASTQPPAGGGGVTGYSEIAQGVQNPGGLFGDSLQNVTAQISAARAAGTLQPVDLRVMPFRDGGEANAREMLDRLKKPEGTEAAGPSAEEQTESRSMLQKLLSLDTPQDMSLGETALDIGAGFVPGVGTVQGARDFERARREGSMLGMGLSALSMVPIAGGAVRAARKAGKARQLLDEIPTAAQAPRLPEPGSPVRAGELRQSGASPADLRQLEQDFKTHQSGVQSVEDLVNTAVRVDPVFQGSVRDVASSVGGAYVPGPPKSAQSITDKLSRKGGTAAGIPDPIRATILVENNVQAEEAIQQIARQYPTIDEGWQRIPGNNYFDRKAAIQFTGPNGERLLGEIQINTPSMQQAKDSMGHKLYEVERRLIQNYSAPAQMPAEELMRYRSVLQEQLQLYRDAATRVDPSILEQVIDRRARGGYIGRAGRL